MVSRHCGIGRWRLLRGQRWSDNAVVRLPHDASVLTAVNMLDEFGADKIEGGRHRSSLAIQSISNSRNAGPASLAKLIASKMSVLAKPAQKLV